MESAVNTLYVFPMNTVLIGFAVVVAMLLVIMIAVLRKPAGARTSAPAAASFSGDTDLQAPGSAYGVSPETVAVIAAAIAAMGEREGKRLIVRAVRRNSDGWSSAGRRESQY